MKDKILLSIVIMCAVFNSLCCCSQQNIWYKGVTSDSIFKLEMFKVEWTNDSMDVTLESWPYSEVMTYYLKYKYKISNDLYVSIYTQILNPDSNFVLSECSWSYLKYERLDELSYKKENIMYDGRIIDIHKIYKRDSYTVDSIFNTKLGGNLLLSEVHHTSNSKRLEHYFLQDKKGPVLTSCYKADTLGQEIHYFFNDGVECHQWKELFIPLLSDESFPGFDSLKKCAVLTKELPEFSDSSAIHVDNTLYILLNGFTKYFVEITKSKLDEISKLPGSTLNGMKIPREIFENGKLRP